HGSPLGDAEVAAARTALGWSHAPFDIPQDIYTGWDARETGAEEEDNWNTLVAAYQQAHPQLAAELKRRLAGELPAAFAKTAADYIAACQQEGKSIATRVASQNTLDAYGPVLPELVGGSADLAGSNNTIWKGCK